MKQSTLILNLEKKAAKFVEGTVLSTVDYHPYLEDVAQTLKKLHHCDLSPAQTMV